MALDIIRTHNVEATKDAITWSLNSQDHTKAYNQYSTFRTRFHWNSKKD